MKPSTLILISLFIICFVCCENEQKTDSNQSGKSMSENNEVNYINNRSIYRKLTEKVIDSIPDKWLVLAINDNLQLKFEGKNEDEQKKIFFSLSEPRKTIRLIAGFESVMSNLGFDEFYNTTEDWEILNTPSALKAIGADKISELVERGNRLYVGDVNKGKLIIGDFGKEYDSLLKLENLNDLQIKYIRKNKRQFIDN